MFVTIGLGFNLLSGVIHTFENSLK